MLYIQLSSFPKHYLVLVITDEEFRYALISVKVLSDTMYANMIMEDIAWLDYHRMHGSDDIIVAGRAEHPEPNPGLGVKRKRNVKDENRETGPGHADPARSVVYAGAMEK